MDPHAIGQRRSLELHRVICEKIREQPDLVSRALERLDTWQSSGLIHETYANVWRKLLNGPVEALLDALVEPSERGSTLRSTSPFAGVVSPRERWAIWKRVES